MSFLATASPPASVDEPGVDNDPFWPALDLGAMRAACRLDGTVTVPRLREATLAAIASVNRELRAWQAQQQQAGWQRLEDLPGPRLGRSSERVVHYRRAVYSAVQADLIEEYRDHDTTGKGDKHADALEPRADTHRRNMRWAISDLLGLPRTTVDLI